jgi:acyl-CoA thioester hydrolase
MIVNAPLHALPPGMPEPSSGSVMGAAHYFPLRVYYDDTDLSGVVYHANYVRWFERARSDLLRILGVDQQAAVEAGEGAYAVADIFVRFVSPAKLDDAVIIQTRVEELGAASARMCQLAFRNDNLLAEARVRVGFISPEGRPRRQPAPWRAAFNTFVAGEFLHQTKADQSEA